MRYIGIGVKRNRSSPCRGWFLVLSEAVEGAVVVVVQSVLAVIAAE
jgi:hypothetical protein